MSRTRQYIVTLTTRIDRTAEVEAESAAQASHIADQLYFNLDLSQGIIDTVDHEILAIEEVARGASSTVTGG